MIRSMLYLALMMWALKVF